MEEKITKLTPTLISKMKGKEKICMLTAYDFPTTVFLEAANVDIILVGDSVGNVVLGYEDTTSVTINEMLHHIKAVGRGIKRAVLVADFPAKGFEDDAFENAKQFIGEGGAAAVKIEGIQHIALIEQLVKSGIPVMGHLGYEPQSMTKPGMQGKTKQSADVLLESAQKLVQAGVFSIVLELVNADLAKQITEKIKIPTIGIGSGKDCDGQVLVTHDLVGLYPKPVPKFVRPYAKLGELLKKAVAEYIADVKNGRL